MAVVSLKQFKGEIPKVPANLLPDENASLARNCDFSKAFLAGLKGGSTYKVPGVALWSPPTTIFSMFSKDGVKIATGDASHGPQYQSPVIDEAFERVYHIHSGRFVVYQWTSVSVDGALPTEVYAGVPAPTSPPVLTLEDVGAIPSYPAAAATFRCWYEMAGTRYQESTITPTLVTAWEEWTFDAPTFTSTGDDEADAELDTAKLVVEITVKNDEALLFRMDTAVGAAIPSRTSALPGGIEMTLTKRVSDADDPGYTISLNWGVIETRAYTFTNINDFNEESAPAPAALISPTYIQKVKIDLTGLINVGFSGFKGFKEAYVYRTYGASTSYLRITNKPTVGSPSVYDADHTAAPSAVVLKSIGWSAPPTPLLGLGNLVLTPTGWFAASSGNTVYMSEPYRPHAWPYSMTFPHEVRGMCVGAQGIVATTSDGVYVITGPHPASAQQVKLDIPVGGICSEGMCNVEGAVVFTSQDGLVTVQGTRGSLELGQTLFTRDEWRDRYSYLLSSMRLSYHDGFLIATSPNAPDTLSDEYGFVLRTDEAAGAFSRFNQFAHTMMRLPINDTLYYVPETGTDNGRHINTFGTGTELSWEWHSKEFTFAKYEAFGALYVRSNDMELAFAMYGDGVLVYSRFIDTGGYYRLPAGKYRRVKITLTGEPGAEVYEIALAATMEELKSA